MAIVRTTLGDIDPAEIGNIMFHEHILVDIASDFSLGNRNANIDMHNRWQPFHNSNL